MFSDPECSNPQQYVRNATLSIDGHSKIKNNDYQQTNSSINKTRQMTWANNTPKPHELWTNNNDATFYTSVNSISGIDPVTQNYIDNLFFKELPKKIAAYVESFNKENNMLEQHIRQNNVSFDEIHEQIKKSEEKIEENKKSIKNISKSSSSFVRLEQLTEITSKIETLSKQSSEIDESKLKSELKADILKEQTKNLKNQNSKISEIEKQLKEIISKQIEMNEALKLLSVSNKTHQEAIDAHHQQLNGLQTSKLNDLQTQFHNEMQTINDSTLKCISHLQEKINDNKAEIDSIKANEKIKDKAHQNLIHSFETENSQKLTTLHSQIEKNTETFHNIEKRIAKVEEMIKNIQTSKQKIHNENEILNNDIKNDLNCMKEELNSNLLKLKADNNEFFETVKKENKIFLDKASLDHEGIINSITNIKNKLNEHLQNHNKSTVNNQLNVSSNNQISDQYNSPQNVSNLKDFEKRMLEKHLELSQNHLLLANDLKDIKETIKNHNYSILENQVHRIDERLQKVEARILNKKMEIKSFLPSVEIKSEKSSFNGLEPFHLTIGEPDPSVTIPGNQIYLPKAYQDYSFNGACFNLDFECILKEPSGPKSARRNKKMRKIKKT
ncbi:hypothetical protein TRFO_19667 [Tritrichomonas foetus]|uniref:Uncharacterized protein n=1 Tax=Tritrichomonas foetus TaxID=1144522 RepID=A0A1J4KM51_9EUKA|nr:hypothetical protein TRFO_19667 [Tritrichomonas foetus]|eukprot:OHT10876.1 hypothetical protein TRFO_19667 [Tritrichomonas foetus]